MAEAKNVSEVSEGEWETVAEESGSKIVFESVGSQYVGTFEGTETINPTEDPNDSFVQLKFRDAAGNAGRINAGYKLLQAFEAIPQGSHVRITRTPDVQMNDPGKNDMKDYRVEVAKS